MSRGAPGCSGVSWGAPGILRCPAVSWDVLGRPRMSWGVLWSAWMSWAVPGCPMVSCGQPGCPRMSRGLLGAGSGAGPSRCPRGWAVPGARSLPALVSPGIQEAPGRAGRAGAGQPHHRDHRQRGGERRERGGAPGRGRFGTGIPVLG